MSGCRAVDTTNAWKKCFLNPEVQAGCRKVKIHKHKTMVLFYWTISIYPLYLLIYLSLSLYLHVPLYHSIYLYVSLYLPCYRPIGLLFVHSFSSSIYPSIDRPISHLYISLSMCLFPSIYFFNVRIPYIYILLLLLILLLFLDYYVYISINIYIYMYELYIYTADFGLFRRPLHLFCEEVIAVWASALIAILAFSRCFGRSRWRPRGAVGRSLLGTTMVFVLTNPLKYTTLLR